EGELEADRDRARNLRRRPLDRRLVAADPHRPAPAADRSDGRVRLRGLHGSRSTSGSDDWSNVLRGPARAAERGGQRVRAEARQVDLELSRADEGAAEARAAGSLRPLGDRPTLLSWDAVDASAADASVEPGVSRGWPSCAP